MQFEISCTAAFDLLSPYVLTYVHFNDKALPKS